MLTKHLFVVILVRKNMGKSERIIGACAELCSDGMIVYPEPCSFLSEDRAVTVYNPSTERLITQTINGTLRIAKALPNGEEKRMLIGFAGEKRDMIHIVSWQTNGGGGLIKDYVCFELPLGVDAPGISFFGIQEGDVMQTIVHAGEELGFFVGKVNSLYTPWYKNACNRMREAKPV